MPKQLLSKNLRWTDVEELNLPQDDEGYYLDADGDSINHKGNFSLRGSNIKIGYTKEMIQEIHKCRESIVYFVNNYVQATTQKGYKHITLYKYQKNLLRDYENYTRIINMQPRQNGKSSTTSFFILYSIIFGKELSFGLAANKLDMSIELLDKVKEGFQSLPLWMQVGVKIWNTKSIVLENKCKIRTAATSGSAFRGMTFSSEFVLKRKNAPNIILSSGLIVDEVAFIPRNIFEEFKKSVFPTVSAGKNSRIIMFSTPQGMNHFHKLWVNAENGSNGFKAIFVPYWEHPDRQEEGWIDKKLADMGGDKVALAQEFLCSFEGSSYSLLDAKTISQFKSSNFSIGEGLLENVKIYEEPKENRAYLMGVDTAKYKGDEFDFSCMQILDVTSRPFKQVATFRQSMATYLDLVPIADELGKYYNNAMIFVENNSGDGQSMVDMLWNNCDYENLYSEKKGIWGFRTTTKSRKIGLQNLKKMADNGDLLIQDAETIEELYGFVLKNGKYQAGNGYSDDNIMALVASLFFLQDPKLFDKDYLYGMLVKPKGEVQQEDEDEFMGFAFFDDGIGTVF